MIEFVAGIIVGVFGLICLVLCQIQKTKESTEKIYFAAFNEFGGIKLYLSHDGSWGSFSEDTILASSVNDLCSKCRKITAEILMIEKIGVSTRFIQSFK